MQLNKKTLSEEQKKNLTDIQKKDLERLRIQQIFEDDSIKGSIIIDEVSSDTFLEFRKLSRTYFSNKDGATFNAMVQLFLAEKSRQKAVEVKT